MRKSIFIFLFALLGVLSAWAYDFEVGGIYYNIISGTDQVEVTSSNSDDDRYSGTLVIPATVEYEGTSYRVTSIGDAAFGDCTGLTSVTIGESVTTIGSSAFRSCMGLTSVTIPESVTSIGEFAFMECYGLRSVTIGEGVTDIGARAFYNCIALLSVTSLAKLPPICHIDNYYSYYEDVFSSGSEPTEYYQKLYVPRGSKSLYESAYEWHKFSKIQEISGVGTATVKVQVNDSTMGSVIGGGEWEYALDEQITLVAVPYPGYYFIKWNDGKTSNPRILTVEGDITLTAIFAKAGGDPTANENSEADNFRVYVQERTIHLSEDRGSVHVYNMAGQCIYNGHATAIPVPQSGVYILVAGSQRCKVLVR